jgi:predicted permease
MNRCRRTVFLLAMFGCVQFLVLSTAAMFFYPGGTRSDNATSGYSFWTNFFSDLGRTSSHSGASNTVSMALFVTALTLVGIALILFFLAMPHYFRETRTARRLSYAGSTFGAISGVCFLGIAAVPSDINLTLHRLFVYTAFTALLAVVICYTTAIFKTHSFSRRYALAYVGFALVLAVYLGLLFAGPKEETDSAVRIQATGQKIVVYAAIVCMFIQAWGAYRLSPSRSP